ncbi:MAG TPA: PH domain-containing protein [Nitrososphaeraceae archaeon]|nr:PH domain-containing protein [Nitrososphaeraceae archaeon]
MPFGFSGNKEEKEKLPSNTYPTDGDDLEEISKIKEMLNPDEKVLLVARQSRIKPGGSLHTPNIIYATDRRIIIRDPYMLGIKENVVDIPYDIVTSVKLERGLLSSTIRFKAPGLMSSTKLGMMDSLIDGEDDQGGIIEAIPKDKAQDLLEIIRSGMQISSNRKFAASRNQKPNELIETKEYTVQSNQSISIADEIRKLAKLKEEGTITEEEFQQMKQDLMRKNRL